MEIRELPRGPVIRIQCFHCCGPGINPLSWETKISQASWYSKKNERDREKMEIVFTSGFRINANCWCNFDYMTMAFLNFFAYILEYRAESP